ncbi:LytTR family transcriptional regulator DNA-binding domain-containing protein [Spirosoma endophyticum]|uniref:LytTr DNA-binding domain-containing protein n=1 Tax=Spirosoma endophyticum TaxID=662367 RepID=A0A1I1YQH1_9BACT|nr:LytTR family transcriptional regulator DNA-binding domain-containing protein [Spirosoma endophyticum]SFE21268.1 LytTr DNA-binding domain-containing protein [Spirosoma endophyticum]
MSVIKPALQRPELIAYFLGANNYSWLHFRNGEKKLLAKPISYMEGVLPNFLRVHKTALINPLCVKNLHQPPRQKMAGQIELHNGEVFPVSRRRWLQVAQALYGHLSPTATSDMPTQPVVDLLEQRNIRNKNATLSILLITNDTSNALLAKQSINKKWPQYTLQTEQSSVHLPDLLTDLPKSECPTLLLLDARTTTQERLHTLQRMKYSQHLCRIPIILLVSPSNQSVIDGYKRQANSVVSLTEGHIPFAQAIERVCQFWLQVAALPDDTA